MTKKIVVVVIISLFILGVTMFAADNSFGAGKTRNVTFGTDVKVGDKILPAGEYKVTHLMEGANHTLVFKTTTNAEKVRVKCQMVDLGKKADSTQSEFKTVDNQRVLTGLVFRGDNFRHAI